MPIIQPLSELRTNTTKIARLAHAESEAIYITKNGYADLVVLSVEEYERHLAKLEVYEKLAASQAEVVSGQKLLPLEEVFAKYKAQYGEA
ncbi:MAG: type II toxin-antitoxin system Phd/YefM family antitoxin [Candidatus Margulisbacteria bacterium]|jgi:PHD/YefM family antitoxin component YafN of YafNO toxin-antitoxin module|nr:type II toxin-antitoxin system Phd/YefM family antitoxin [Candidatus Margulisiibacteriota bacterium]